MIQSQFKQQCGQGARKEFRNNQMPPFKGFRRPKYNVPMNIVDNETEFEVHVFATGFGKENIILNVVDDSLLISGSKEILENPNFSMQEFPIKNFERTLNLNKQVDVTKISAESKDGILIIKLPKTEAAKNLSQQIEVK